MDPQHFQSGQKVRFDSLSDELLLSIIQMVGLPDPENYGHKPTPLSPLATTSRRLRGLTEPFLHGKFVERHQSDEKNVRDLYLFMRRILTRPELAKYVRAFQGAVPGCEWKGQDEERDSNDGDEGVSQGNRYLSDLPALTEEDWIQIQAAVRAVGLSRDHHQQWIQGIRSGDWEAMTTLILSLLPNLQYLTFSSWGHKEHEGFTHLERFLERIYKLQKNRQASPCSLAGLTVIQLYFNTAGWGGMGMDFGSLLRIPSLRKFSAGPINNGDYYEDPNGPTPDDEPVVIDEEFVYNVTDLSLQHAVIHHEHLMDFLLYSFPSLEKFYFEFGDAIISEETPYEFEPPRYMAALETLKDSLLELTFKGQRLEGEEFEHYPIGSFVGFKKLKFLCLDAGILFGSVTDEIDFQDESSSQDESEFRARIPLHEVIPHSLETLQIDEFEYLENEPLFALVPYLPSFPNLKKLDLGWQRIIFPDKPSPREPTSHPGFTQEEAIRFIDGCKDAGVEVVIHGMNPPIRRADGYDIDGNYKRHVVLFRYPWDGYEEYCKKNGLNLATGQESPDRSMVFGSVLAPRK